MDPRERIDQALEAALVRQGDAGTPPRLMAAMRHAVFPGGGRMRPRLALAVAAACGEDLPAASDAAAVAVELMHCASLVHDDLPCFDDAETRRGQPAVHRAYGEPLAVLAGDALILLAFQVLARDVAAAPQRMGHLITITADAVGLPSGIIAGQGWESEPEVDLSQYHQAKTGALFAAATMAGAAAAGREHAPWGAVGARLGEAYQVADDLRDLAAKAEDLGKPVGRDAELGRPNAPEELGIPGAVKRLEGLLAAAAEAVPSCPGEEMLKSLIKTEASRFLPKELARYAA